MNTKRMLALIICVVLLLTMVPVAVLSTGAADVEGDWTTYRSADEYDDPDETYADWEELPIYRPEAGYKYTSEGLTVVPADYTGTTPFVTVQTKEPQPVKDGIYLQFRIDDYAYDGGTGTDQWICLTLSTEAKVAPGSTQYGGGWLTLIRGNGDGNCTLSSCLTDPATATFGGTFEFVGDTTCTAPMDSKGREIYTLEITWNGSAYEMKINGVAVPDSSRTTELLERLAEYGDFYVGITMMSRVRDSMATLTVLKYGTCEADATVPVGTDSKSADEVYGCPAEPFDPDGVEPGTPAVLWASETCDLRAGYNITFTESDNGAWRGTATDEEVSVTLSQRSTSIFRAEDFPVFGVLVRNLRVESGTLWYAAGEIVSAHQAHTKDFSVRDGRMYGEGGEYVFIPVDLTDLWEGRIHHMRMDFEMSDPASREFDLCFAGMFRSEDEAYAYANTWLTGKGIASAPETEAPATEAPEAPATEAPETEAPAAGTEAPADGTRAPDAGAETDAPAKKGCGGVIGMGSVAVVAAATAFVALKRKE